MTAERDVLYTLRLKTADQNRQVLDAWLANIQAADKKAQESARKLTDFRISEAKRAVREEEAARKSKAAADEAARKKAEADAKSLVTKSMKDIDQAISRVDALREKMRVMLTESAAGVAKLAKSIDALTTTIHKVEKRAQQSATDSANHAIAESNRRAKVEDDLRRKTEREAEASRRKEEAKGKADAARSMRDLEQATARVDAMRERMRGLFNQGSDGLLKMGRGFAMLGVTGQEDMRKLLESLVKIQAAFDILRGGLDVYSSLTQGVKAYREAVIAAAAAEKALGASRGASAAAGAASATTGAAAAGAGVAAPRAIASVAGAGGAAAGAPILAGLAALASWAAAIKVLGETMSGTAMQTDSLSYKIGHLEASMSDWAMGMVGIQTRFLADTAGQDVSFLGVGEADEVRAMAGVERRDARLRASRRAQDLSLQASSLTSTDPLTSARLRFSQAGQARGAAIGELGQSQTTAGQIESQQRLVDMQFEYIAAARELMEASKRDADLKIAASERVLQLSMQEKQIREDIIRANEQSLMSARERFGQMSPEEQARLIAAKAKAERFGATSLTREESAALRGVGLGRTTELASQADQARATAAGFDAVFGGQERAAIAQARAEVRSLDVTISDQRQIQIDVERDQENLARAIAVDVAEKVKESEQMLRDLVKRELDAALEQIDVRQNQRINQLNAARGG